MNGDVGVAYRNFFFPFSYVVSHKKIPLPFTTFPAKPCRGQQKKMPDKKTWRFSVFREKMRKLKGDYPFVCVLPPPNIVFERSD